jgi:hypothetical protein
MVRFVDLSTLEGRMSAGGVPHEASERLPGYAASSNLRLWAPGGVVPENKTCLLVGVALFRQTDLHLLDTLNELADRDLLGGAEVNIFDE